MTRGRRKAESPSIPFFIHLRLSEVEDADLIQFFQSIPKRRRATAIKSALRAGGMQSVGAGVEDAEDDEALAASVDDFLK
jgi:inhibitor of KinA sporulation pathway (predicted exonuclease)